MSDDVKTGTRTPLPGPYEVDWAFSTPGHVGIDGIIYGEPSRIAEVTGGRNLAECNAIARLLAAAPDLLIACEKALPPLQKALKVRTMIGGPQTGGIADVIAVLERAIAKARGA